MTARPARALLALTLFPALVAVRGDDPPAVGEPTCRAAAGAHPDVQAVRWIGGPAGDRTELDRWCAGVGPPIVLEGPSSPTSADALTVASWNTAVGAASLEDFVGDLRGGRLDADVPAGPFVLLLQEAYGAGAPLRPPAEARGAGRRIEPRGPDRDIAALARRLDLHLVYVPSMRNGSADVRTPGDRGNAILSSLPLFDPVALELPLERERRVAVGARVRGRTAAGQAWSLRVVSAHLDNRAPWRNPLRSLGKARTRQARWLVEALAGEAAVALGGDLNTWLRGPDARALSVLREAFSLPQTPPRRPTLVVPAAPDRQVDYLRFRLPPGRCAVYRVLEDTYGSDHRPLLGCITLGGSAGGCACSGS